MPQGTKEKSTRLPYTTERSKLRGSHGQRPWFYCLNKNKRFQGDVADATFLNRGVMLLKRRISL